MKSRFCPSPTGYIHLGNARTALFNFLIAQAQQGHFLLRIEDTDAERSKQEYVVGLMRDLHWLGAVWDEGADAKGEHGPYYQSQRADIYEQYYQKLMNNGQAYPCFCSEDQLALSRKIQRAQGQAPRYAGTCRNLTTEEVQAKIAKGEKATLRFKMPKDELIEFDDLVKGKQQFNSNDIGDFIIRRADGGSSFMFCNAVDDALMQVTMVMRGEDHLTNSPRQIMILKALNLPQLTYAHISLIVGQDGSPLSKRHGSKSIAELRELGYLPVAVVNYLARLGHSYENPDFMSMSELCEQFSAQRLGSAPAKFDAKQLDYWQKIAVMALTADEIKQWLGEHFIASLAAEKVAAFIQLVQPNIVFPADALVWRDILFADTLVLQQDAQEVIAQAGNDYLQALQEALTNHGENYQAITAQLKETLGVKGKALFQPLRVALTGQLHGPELAPILQLMGASLAIERVKTLMK